VQHYIFQSVFIQEDDKETKGKKEYEKSKVFYGHHSLSDYYDQHEWADPQNGLREQSCDKKGT
jgi:hypothetical protein